MAYTTTVSKDGKTLNIAVDLTAKPTRSASGKSDVIASSHGNISIEGGLKMGLNLYRPL